MKLLIFHFALLFVLVIANPISQVEDPVDETEPAEELNEIPDQEVFEDPLEINPEYGDHFEGDIILSPEEEINMRSGRLGLKDTKKRWPKSGGYVRVPYTLSSGYTETEKKAIKSAMDEIAKKTCVRFHAWGLLDYDFIRIIHGSGCSSEIGKRGGRQDVILEKAKCTNKGNAMHELIHALGFQHQHNHYQRDQKVKVNTTNIISGYVHNFEKVTSSTYSNFNTAYDINSIMHYGGNAFSKNGKLTIQAINPADQNKMGQRTAMSSGDIIRIKTMYGCL